MRPSAGDRIGGGATAIGEYKEGVELFNLGSKEGVDVGGEVEGAVGEVGWSYAYKVAEFSGEGCWLCK